MSFILLDNDSWLLEILLKAFNIRKDFFTDFFLLLSLSLSFAIATFIVGTVDWWKWIRTLYLKKFKVKIQSIWRNLSCIKFKNTEK